jgi:predicted TIM-barrel fold metal-dependent hydrolase
MTEHRDWLAQTVETPLEPGLPIVDPHHHFWDRSPRWITDRYLLDDIVADIGTGHNIVATVFIECGEMYKTGGPAELRPVGETEFVNGIAAMSASGRYGPARVAAGIIGFADLTLGEAVAPVLEAHIAAGGGRFRGIRYNVVWDASDAVPVARERRPPHLYLDDAFRAGFAQLARHELTFEAWCFHPQIPELTDLARAFPDTVIILDHLGGPLGVGPYAGRRDEVFTRWRGDIAALAKCPNVHAKLGGLNMPINGYGWRDRPQPPTSEELNAATKDWYGHALDVFGPERCMFESNFPVDSASCSYVVLWNSFKRLAAGCSADEKALLFHDTARRLYRL